MEEVVDLDLPSITGLFSGPTYCRGETTYLPE